MSQSSGGWCSGRVLSRGTITLALRQAEPVQIGTRLDTGLPSKSLLSSQKSRDWQRCCLCQALVRCMVSFADVSALT